MALNQYFENNPETSHAYQAFSFELKGKKFHFTTDSNVFSKSTIDFGSRLLIHAFEAKELPEGAILDVGCGYGPIGLSLAFATKRHVEMIDVNHRAIACAKENATKNGIENIAIYPSDLYEAVGSKEFAAIVSNPPIRAGKKVVHEILEKAYDHLKPGGTLTIVIQKKQGAPSASKKMEEVFGNVSVRKKEKGYFIFESKK